MKKKQIKSLNSLDLENEVGKKFNSNKKIKTVWQNTIKDTGGYFSPLATLCLVVAIGVKNQILIDSKELEKILNNWKLEPVISSIEIIFLTSYKKYLDKIGFKIPKANMSMAFDFSSKKTVFYQGKEVYKKMTKKELATKYHQLTLIGWNN